MVEPLIISKPEIFNVFVNVEAPVIYKLLKFVLLFINVIVFVEMLFKLLNMVVDVAFKLLILNCAQFEKLFKLLNMVVDVEFKLLILNWALVEKLFKLLNIDVDVNFKFSIFKLLYVDKAFKFAEVAPLDKLLNTDKPDTLISDKQVKLL